jgi:hypothetical protein
MCKHTSIHSLTTHSRRHTDLQVVELSERCQARWDGAFQIVVVEIPIGGEEQKVEGGAVDGWSVMSITRTKLTAHSIVYRPCHMLRLWINACSHALRTVVVYI